MSTERRRLLAHLVMGLAFTTLAALVLVTGYSYPPSSARFPVFIGWIFLALTLTETAVQAVALLREAGGPAPAPAKDSGRLAARELGGILWLAALVLLLYLLGFVVAIPLYVFAFLRLAAGRRLRDCAVLAVVVSAFVYIVFVWLLEYRLYAGLLFGAG